MAKKPIYLDHNATTPIDSEVVDAMLPFLKENFGNPSSSHWYGTQAKQAVEQARQSLAELLGCFPDEGSGLCVSESGQTHHHHSN